MKPQENGSIVLYFNFATTFTCLIPENTGLMWTQLFRSDFFSTHRSSAERGLLWVNELSFLNPILALALSAIVICNSSLMPHGICGNNKLHGVFLRAFWTWRALCVCCGGWRMHLAWLFACSCGQKSALGYWSVTDFIVFFLCTPTHCRGWASGVDIWWMGYALCGRLRSFVDKGRQGAITS